MCVKSVVYIDPLSKTPLGAGTYRADKGAALQARVKVLEDALAENEAKIVAGLNAVQGGAVDVGAYYQPNAAMESKVMRPSEALNAVLAAR